jgi:hypothetical protein
LDPIGGMILLDGKIFSPVPWCLRKVFNKQGQKKDIWQTKILCYHLFKQTKGSLRQTLPLKQESQTYYFTSRIDIFICHWVYIDVFRLPPFKHSSIDFSYDFRLILWDHKGLDFWCTDLMSDYIIWISSSSVLIQTTTKIICWDDNKYKPALVFKALINLG